MVVIVKSGDLQKDMFCGLKLLEITLHEIDTEMQVHLHFGYYFTIF